ncbi:MAG: hypothetical protein ACE5NA_04520, partial [Nitrospiraceae bacterium]
MNIQRSFLHSKVARRVFMLFILCALLPVTVLSITSFVHVRKQLKEQTYQQLRQASKTVGMAIYERLLFLEADLDLIASKRETFVVKPDKTSVDTLAKDVTRRFTALGLLTPSGDYVQLLGRSLTLPELTEAERQHMSTGRTLVSGIHYDRSDSRIVMSRLLDGLHPEMG